MSIYKSILHGKDHRRMYYGAKLYDKQCRCHGSCEWCQQNRMHKNLKRLEASKVIS